MAGTQTAEDIRFIGRIAGKYTLPGRPPRSGVSVFACRTQGLTSRTATVCAPVSAAIGAPVSANFDQLGILHGEICRHVDGGFTMELDPERNNLEKFNRRIAWLKKRQVAGVPENREYKRVIPRCPQTQVVLADGQKIRGFIIDMSSSGVALSMDYRPEIGTPLAVGTIIGRVVRYLDVGFAVQFTQVQSLEELESKLVHKPADKGNLAQA